MKPYRAVIFDLFNTVALWRPDRMPRFTWRGETRPSSLGVLRELLAEAVPSLAFDDFYDALERTNGALARERDVTLREIPSRERFSRTLIEAGFEAGSTDHLAERLSLSHMEVLGQASFIPSAHREWLLALSRHYRIGLISNFDHAPTALAILKRDEMDSIFEHMLISDSHGWRKPAKRIFDDALGALGVDPGDALYVGDSVDDDVVGAQNAGIDVAWVNAREHELPAGVTQPTYTINSILDLAQYLK